MIPPLGFPPQDIVGNWVVRIAGEVGVDVSRQAWQVRYADAIATAEAIPIEVVRVPFLSLEILIESETTCREEDRADFVRLRDPLELKRVSFFLRCARLNQWFPSVVSG